MPNIFDQPDELQNQEVRQNLLPDSMPLSTPTPPIQYNNPLLRRVPTSTPPATGDVPYTLEAVPGSVTPPPAARPTRPPGRPLPGEEEPADPEPLPEPGTRPTPTQIASPTQQQLEPGEEAQPLSYWEFLPVSVYNPAELIDPNSAAPRDIPIDQLLSAYGEAGTSYADELLLGGVGELSTDPRAYTVFGQGERLRSDQLAEAVRNYQQNVSSMTERTLRAQAESQRPVGVGMLPDGTTRIFPSTRNAFFGLPMSQAARSAMERPDTYFQFQPPFGQVRGWQRFTPAGLIRSWANKVAFDLDVARGLGAGLLSELEGAPDGLLSQVLNAFGAASSSMGVESLPGTLPAPGRPSERLSSSRILETALRESVALQDIVRAFTPVVDEQGRSVTNVRRGQFGQFGTGPVSGLLYLANIASPQTWLTAATLDLSEVAAGAPYRARMLDPLRGVDLGFTQEYNADTVPYGTINNPRLARIRGYGAQTALGALTDLFFGGVDAPLVAAVRPGGLISRNVRRAARAVGIPLPSERVIRSTATLVSNAAASSTRVVRDPTVPRWREDVQPAPFVFANPPISRVDAPSSLEFWEPLRQRALAQLRDSPAEQARVRGRMARAEIAAARAVSGSGRRGLVHISDTARVVEYPALRLSTPLTETVVPQPGRAGRLIQQVEDTNDEWWAMRQAVEFVEEQKAVYDQQLEQVSSRMRTLVDDIVTEEDGLSANALGTPAEFEARRAAVAMLEEEYAALNVQRLELTRQRNLWVYASLKESPLSPRISLAQYAAGVYQAHARTYRIKYLAPEGGLVASGRYASVDPSKMGDTPSSMVVESMLLDDYLEQAMPRIEAQVLQPSISRAELPGMFRSYPELAGDTLMSRVWREDEQLDALLRVMGILEPDAPPLDAYRLASLRGEWGNAVARFGSPVPMESLLAPVKRVQLLPADPLVGRGPVTYALDRMPPVPALSLREVRDAMTTLAYSPQMPSVQPARVPGAGMQVAPGALPLEGLDRELAQTLGELSRRNNGATTASRMTGREQSILRSYGIEPTLVPSAPLEDGVVEAAYRTYMERLRRLDDLSAGVVDNQDYIEAFYDTELAKQNIDRLLASNPTEAARRYVEQFADQRLLVPGGTENREIVQQMVLTGLAEVNYQNVARESAQATQVVEVLAVQVAEQQTKVASMESFIPRSPMAELVTRKEQGLPVPEWDGPSPNARNVPEVPASRMVVDVDAVRVVDPLETPPPNAVMGTVSPGEWLALPPSATPDLRTFAQDVLDSLTSIGNRLSPARRNLGAALSELRRAYNNELAPRTRAILDELWERHQSRLPEKPEVPAAARTQSAPTSEQQQRIREIKKGLASILTRAGEEPATSVRQALDAITRLYRSRKTPAGIIRQIDELWAEYGNQIPVALPERPAVTRRAPRREGSRIPRDEMPRSLTRVEKPITRPANSREISAQGLLRAENPEEYLVDATPEELLAMVDEVLEATEREGGDLEALKRSAVLQRALVRTRQNLAPKFGGPLPTPEQLNLEMSVMLAVQKLGDGRSPRTVGIRDVAAEAPPVDEGQELPTLEELFRQADEIGTRYQNVETSPQTEMEVRRLADQILNESGFDRAKSRAQGTDDVSSEWVRMQLEQRIRGEVPETPVSGAMVPDVDTPQDFLVRGTRSELPPGTIFFDDQEATPGQKEWMVKEGQDYMTPEDVAYLDLDITTDVTEDVLQRITTAMEPPKKRDSFRTIVSRSLFHGSKLADGVDPMQGDFFTSPATSLINELGVGLYLTTDPNRARTYALALRNPDIIPAPGLRFSDRGRVLEYRFDPDFLAKRQMLDADKSLAELPNNKLLAATADAFVLTAVDNLPEAGRAAASRRLRRMVLTEPPRTWWHGLRKEWIRAYGSGNQVGLRDVQVSIATSYPDKLQGFFRLAPGGHYDIMVLPGFRDYGEPTLLRDASRLGRGTVEEGVIARLQADTDQLSLLDDETTRAAREYSLLRADAMNLELAKAEEAIAFEKLVEARQKLSATEQNLEEMVAQEQRLRQQALQERAAEEAYLRTRKFQPDNNYNNPCA